MRQLKHHENKLLKKVDFLSWKADAGLREVKVMRRYHVQERYVCIMAHLCLGNCFYLAKAHAIVDAFFF